MRPSTQSAPDPAGGSPAAAAFGVVVPVKRLAVAKSRLAELGDDLRRDLVAAFAVDTVAAALDCPRVGSVLVVTDELSLLAPLRDLGADVIPDGHDGDLNGSLVQGAAELLRRRPGLWPTALCADLPALRGDELTSGLDRVAASLEGDHDKSAQAFVRDADGAGTTLYAASTLGGFAPRFGSGSARSHLAADAVEISANDLPTLRRDVDTPSDLEDARSLGVGARTSFVLTSRWGPGQPS